MRGIGVEIGKRTTIFNPDSVCIDITRPWLVKIGDDVQITSGVTILTHGFDWSVLKGVYGEVLGSSGQVTIGNNVFIGMHTTILKGVTIGDNVIIGANSLVNKDISDNTVVGGNPAKVIMSLDDYYKKRKKSQLSEVTELVQRYRKVYGKEPDERVLHEFFYLFESGEYELHPAFDVQMKIAGNYEKSYKTLRKESPKFSGMKDFLKKI